jgi:uncharacterized protein
MGSQEIDQRVAAFLDGAPHAVVGASNDRAKYGNIVLRAYLQQGLPVYPVNPTADEVEGLKAYPNLAALPEQVHGISIITPPAITEKIIQEAAALGIRHVWMQPGAESSGAIARARRMGMNVIGGDACILVVFASGEH